jgi:hypothetical protein
MESPVAVYAQNSATDRLVRCGPRATNGGSAGRVRCGSVNGTVELSSRTELSRVAVRWAVPVPEHCAGTRGRLGTLVRRPAVAARQPERVLPWYWLAHDGERTFGMGVEVQPFALCGWTVDTEGVTLWLDVSAVAVPNETLPRSEITV